MDAEMEWWTKIRKQVEVERVSKRQVPRETGIHWRTLEKILTHSSPPGYQLSDLIFPFAGSSKVDARDRMPGLTLCIRPLLTWHEGLTLVMPCR